MPISNNKSQNVVEVALGLGSNLPSMIKGKSRNLNENITFATYELTKKICTSNRVKDVRIAPTFTSKPVNCPPGSPDFCNTVIIVYTILSPFEILKITKKIEKTMGRESAKMRAKKGINLPRPIDIDILYYGREKINSNDPFLIVPHPRMRDRDFVMTPLKMIKPDYK